MGRGLLQSDTLPAKQFRRLPSGLRHSADWFGWADPQPHLSRKARRRPEGPAEGNEGAELERRRRATQGARRTILAGALGPAATGRSVLGS